MLLLNKEAEDVVIGILELEENEGLSSILILLKLVLVNWDYPLNKRNDAITALIIFFDIFCLN